MKTRFVFIIAGSFVGSVLSSPLAAQQDRIAAAELTPYAGYMISSTLLDGPLGTGIASAGRSMYGVQLGVPLTNNISLVGNLAHASGDLEVGLPILGGIPFGTSATWLADAGIQLGVPIGSARTRSLTPFIQLGAGAMRQSLEVTGLSATATNFAFNAGAGLDLAFSRNVGITLMAKDYIGKFDFEEATTFDLDRGSAHNFAISAGLRLAF